MESATFTVAAIAALLAVLFSSLHLSLLSMVRSNLLMLSSQRRSKHLAERINRILEDPDGHARSMALIRLLCTIALVSSILWWRFSTGIDGHMPSVLSVATTVLVLVIVLWFVSVIIPTAIASHAGDRLIVMLSGLVRAVSLVERPLGPIARFFDEVVRRLAGAQLPNSTEALEAEILSVIDEGEREGTIDQVERDMIEAVVEFRSTTVEQIMTPRTEIEALQATDNLGEIVRFVQRVGHSRIPVYEDDLDHVIGVLYAKDLLPWVSNGMSGFSIRKVIRPAVFVPEVKTVRQLLAELVEQKVHLAMVADEYGGTSGLVTIEDIVEEVFGDIQDEYEAEDDDPPRIDVNVPDQIIDADARAYLDDVNDALEQLGVQLPETDDYDTLGGFIVTTLGHIPESGEQLVLNGITITITDSSPTRVLRVVIRVTPIEDLPAPATAADRADGK